LLPKSNLNITYNYTKFLNRNAHLVVFRFDMESHVNFSTADWS